MAYDVQSLGTYSTDGGDITVKLYYDTASGVVAGDFPTDWKPVVSMGDIVERCEEEAGTIEIPTLDVEIMDEVSLLYPEGILYHIISEQVDGDYPPPELRIELSRGGVYSVLFWGVFDLTSTTFIEHHNGAQLIRSIDARLISALFRFKSLDMDTYLTNMLAARGVEENPHQKAAPTLLYTGTAGAITYGYRVAVRDANGEYAWSNEVTVGSCSDLDGTHYIDVSWPAVTGATSYAVYRTTVSGGALQVGFLAEVTSGVTFRDDGSPDGNGVTGQTKLSARKFIKYTDFFRCAVVEAFSVSYSANLVPNIVDDIKTKYGTTEVGAENTFFLYWYNTGSIATPTMGLTPYFDSTSTEYFGSRYSTVLELLGSLTRQFAQYPRFYDVEATSGSGALPRIDLLTRRQPLTQPTLDGSLAKSSLTLGTQFTTRSVMAYRSRHRETRYSTNEQLKDWTLEIPCDFCVTTDTGAVNAFYAPFLTEDYEGIYWVDQGTVTTAYLIDGAEYFNGSTWVAAGTADYQVNLRDGTALIKTPLQAALVEYFRILFSAGSRMYEREYFGITSTVGSTSSEANTTVLAVISLNDGMRDRNFYINEVRKNVPGDRLYLRLIEQL